MKKLKKALSLTLALALALALAVPAMAAGYGPYTLTFNSGYDKVEITFDAAAVSEETLTLNSRDGSYDYPCLIVHARANSNVNVVVTSEDDPDASFTPFPYYARNGGALDIVEAIYIDAPFVSGNISDWYNAAKNRIDAYFGNKAPAYGEAGVIWNESSETSETVFITVDEGQDAAQPDQPTEAAVTTVEVAASNNQRLNVRSGPGTNYKIAAPALKNGTILQISEISGQWGKLADGRGWVYLPATRTISKPAAPAETEQPAEPPMGLGGPSENDLMDPTEPTNPAQPEQPAAPAGAGSYTARKGDTWSSICINFYGSNAQRYNLMNANKGVALKEGAVITLPAKLGKDVLIPAPAAAEGEKLYTVVRGDTLGRIAAAEYGKVSEYKAIFERNADRLKNADSIYEGQVIVLPAKK